MRRRAQLYRAVPARIAKKPAVRPASQMNVSALARAIRQRPLGTLMWRATSRSDFGERRDAHTVEVCLDDGQHVGDGHSAPEFARQRA